MPYQKVCSEQRRRLLVFVVAYNAESTLEKVLSRIPESLAENYQVEILAIDDASTDRTFEVGNRIKRTDSSPFRLHVLVNPENQGYGGNQKLGYHYALNNDFDFVALLHGDGQYAPEFLPALVEPLREGSADAVFGSRMLVDGAARTGRMPLYKFVGNKILTWFENRILRTKLSEFHSGYRIYSTEALRRIPFERNTNDFHFDTEIIIQLLIAKQRILELPIPTYYGDEICHVNGMKYALDVVLAVLRARVQESGILYDPKFDCEPANAHNAQYRLKRGYESSHEVALRLVKTGSRVLDLGCAGGFVGELLRRERGCTVTGVDTHSLAPGVTLDKFIGYDLNLGPPEVNLEEFDYVLMLDVIEHLTAPESFIDNLRVKMSANLHSKLVISTGNIAFIVIRLMLLFGQFNYGKRGILDLTHTRLLTSASLRRLLEQGGFKVVEVHSIPAPFPLALGNGWLGRRLVAINAILGKLLKGLLSYQIMMVAEPRPTVGHLLERAVQESANRVNTIDLRATNRASG
jgi:glycosyltransferase involved in cell wall biosynthesis